MLLPLFLLGYAVVVIIFLREKDEALCEKIYLVQSGFGPEDTQELRAKLESITSAQSQERRPGDRGLGSTLVHMSCLCFAL